MPIKNLNFKLVKNNYHSFFILFFCLLYPLFSHASNLDDNHTIHILNNLTYGVNSSTLNQYKNIGKEQYLNNQLIFHNDNILPLSVEQQIDSMNISKLNTLELLHNKQQLEQQLKNSSSPDEKEQIQKSINQFNSSIIQETSERRILRDIYSSNQLQELLTWFWFNHFNVFQYKGNNSLFIPDYEEHAIRPHVLGKFHDLLLATLTHPAMLTYLDNNQNNNGSVNENYAREIMELHTMGVNSGYSQKDVENLALILTGVGFTTDICNEPPNTLKNNASSSLFCFNSKRHNHNEKVFLGQTFPGGGNEEEVIRAINLLSKQPATAKFISKELAMYFLNDNPPDNIINDMANTFSNTDGDIAKTLNTLFHSDEFLHNQHPKFKDSVWYVLSSIRLLYDKQPIEDVRPIINWINQLGEPFYTHLTPDGYGLTQQNNLSADQIAQRFNIAHAISSNAGVLYTNETQAISLEMTDKQQLQKLHQAAKNAHPIDTFGIYELIRPILSDNTSVILRQSLTMDEWNSLLLSSPEFMYR